MRAAGAVSLHNGVWALPSSPKCQQIMGEIVSYVNARGGSSSTFIARATGADMEAGLLDAFAKNIGQDYAEFVDKCRDFRKEIETEIGQKKLTFAELEENEAGLQKLTSWLRKIRARDYFGNEKAQDALNALDGCRSILRSFARSVYTSEGMDVPDNEGEYSDE